MTPDTMVYASTRRGYQPALVNTTTSVSQYLTTPKLMIDDVEAGIKSEGRFGTIPWRFNGAAYYEWLRDSHRGGFGGIIDPRTNLSVGAVLPVQKAIVKRLEAELKVIAAHWVQVSMFADYIDAQYKTFTAPILGVDPTDPPCADSATRPQCRTIVTGSQDLSKDDFSYAPMHHFGSTVRLSLPTSRGLGDVSLTATYYHQAKYHFASTSQEPEAVVEPQNLVNLRLDWKNVLKSRVDLAAYVRNATNQTYLVGGDSQQGSTGITYGLYGEPRMYGVESPCPVLTSWSCS
ncbi:MAG: TonB-dependent receptor [Novosphingobium sp.]|nr:TonB-dependent receptor [Novosphingobium sp.]